MLCSFGNYLTFKIIWQLMRILNFLQFLTQNLKTFKFSKFAHLQYRSKNITQHMKKKTQHLIDFCQFSAFKCVLTEKPIFSLMPRLSQISKSEKKNDTKLVNSKHSQKDSGLYVAWVRLGPRYNNTHTHTYIWRNFSRDLTCDFFLMNKRHFFFTGRYSTLNAIRCVSSERLFIGNSYHNVHFLLRLLLLALFDFVCTSPAYLIPSFLV